MFASATPNSSFSRAAKASIIACGPAKIIDRGGRLRQRAAGGRQIDPARQNPVGGAAFGVVFHLEVGELRRAPLGQAAKHQQVGLPRAVVQLHPPRHPLGERVFHEGDERRDAGAAAHQHDVRLRLGPHDEFPIGGLHKHLAPRLQLLEDPMRESPLVGDGQADSLLVAAVGDGEDPRFRPVFRRDCRRPGRGGGIGPACAADAYRDSGTRTSPRRPRAARWKSLPRRI